MELFGWLVGTAPILTGIWVRRYHMNWSPLLDAEWWGYWYGSCLGTVIGLGFLACVISIVYNAFRGWRQRDTRKKG
jgi:hypothetical protein